MSAATIWELEIKRALGRLEVDGDLAEFSRDSGFHELPVSFAHAQAAASLPAHHSDPFDRMLVAQAQAEGLTLLTADAELERYEVPTLPARQRGQG